MSAKTIGVIAGNYDEFRSYMQLEVPRPNYHHYVYLGGVSAVRNQRLDEVRRIGTWKDHPKLTDIEIALKAKRR